MSHTIDQIARALGLEAAGDTGLAIQRAAEPADAGAADLALAMAPKYAEALSKGRARAALVWAGADWQAMGLEAAIFAPRPRLAMAGLTAMMDPGQRFGDYGAGIHPTAVVHDSAELGADVAIGPLCVIGPGARIGAGSVIGPQCHLGAGAVLGEGAFLREMVSIGARVRIGARFIAQPGARIGADGFSFVTPEVSTAETARQTMGDTAGARPQSWVRIHSLGAVRIGDDVEIGANATIDYGTIRDTVIGDGTKIDNAVHVGHNVRTGRDCLFAAHTGISGSVDIGNHVILGGQVGVVDNIYIGDGVVAAGGTKILSNVPAGRVMMGYPAVQMETNTQIYRAQRRLPRLMRDLDALKKAVFKQGPSE